MADPIAIKTIIYAVAGGFLPALVWLWFWLHEDNKKPEPKKLILGVFIAGGISVFIAFILQRLFIEHLAGGIDISDISQNASFSVSFILLSLPILIAWALIEELVKFVAVWVTSLKSEFNDEPIDPMIYMITGALGFVAVENTLFVFDALFNQSHHIEFLITGNMRFLGASIVHIVSSAVIGAAISLSYCSSPKVRRLNIVFGFILGTLLHGLFNFFIIMGGQIGLFKIFAVWWLVAIAILFFFEKVKHIVCSPSFTDKVNNINQQ